MAHILIVDDDEIVAELAANILIEAGHACGWVTDGDKVLQLLKWRRPDLLLLDQDMPGMSGRQVLREVRQSARNYDLPVIMFTAIQGAEDEAAAMYGGAQAYVRKPFDRRFLLHTVKLVLHSREGRPAHRELREVMEYNAGRGREDGFVTRAV
ncbi:response regulator [Qipengyuania soli]|uniref:Response regulator n=1 Tax=Qipengyuania soli TaxID=2782568 RepID=A0A7S8F2K5_9SPHN|nr:response regulator [Qipengyuania soli]QPC97885.1 response regulator [Qipengyuania soli]